MKVKILLSYHKDSPVVNNDVFLPVRVGKDKDALTGIPLRDDEGENIADKNPTYNELTAVYYAWKNYEKIGDPDYIGLNHYRRFFIFDDKKYAYYESKNYVELMKKIDFDEEKIERILKEYDFVAPMPNPRRSVYDNYVSAHKNSDLDKAMEIIKADHAEYYDSAKKYIVGQKAYFYNFFIFKKEEFFRYCEWLFDILEKLDKVREKPDERLFVSECLTGIYFTYLLDKGQKMKELPVLYIGKKAGFSESVQATKANLRNKNSSFLYAIKPMIVFFTPNSVLMMRKRKSAK